jgi:DNA polymerase-1
VKLPFYLENPTASWYDEVPWLCVDFETTNVEKGDPLVAQNKIVLTSTQASEKHEPLVFGGFQYLDYDGFGKRVLVAHNAKFELGWLLREGVDIANILPWDTMLAEYVIAGNRRFDLSLGATAKRYGFPGKEPVVDRLIKAGVCPSEIPRKWLEDRVRYDVETTLAIARKQHEILKRDGLMNVFFTRCIVTPVLAAIEREGMRLDPERVNDEYNAQLAARSALETELDELTGGINLRSGKQVGEFLYDTLKFEEPKDRKGNPKRTKAGARSTSKATLSNLRATTKDQKRFVRLQGEYSKANARITKALDFFRRVCTEQQSVFRGRFNQAVTQTHRLSSSGRRITFGDGRALGVQFQNLPREYKRLFRAESGRVLVEVDGAQLEFRVAGQLGADPQVLSDVASGADVHRFTASVLGHKSEEEVTDKERTAAKAHTFKPLYGGNSGTRREVEYYEAFRAKYKAVEQTQKSWCLKVLNEGKLRIASGLIFYWPGTGMSKSGYIDNTPSIYNYPIQSFATADIIPISLAYTYWGARHLDVRIINTVHDSVVADVADEDVEAYKQVVQEAWLDRTYQYLDKVYGVKMTIPLAVGWKAGAHWGEGQEIKYTKEYE